jgi:hypothetical protein
MFKRGKYDLTFDNLVRTVIFVANVCAKMAKATSTSNISTAFHAIDVEFEMGTTAYGVFFHQEKLKESR